MNINKWAIASIIAVLLIINFLTFHDFFETHTVKDWMIIFVSVLIFVYFTKISFKKANLG